MLVIDALGHPHDQTTATTIPYVNLRLAAHPRFAAGAVDTGFIERYDTALVPPLGPAPEAALAAAALSRLIAREAAAREDGARSSDPFSPWARIDGWRLSGRADQDLVFHDGAAERKVSAITQGGDWLLQIEGQRLAASAEHRPDGTLSVVLDGVRRTITVLEHDRDAVVFLDGGSWRLVEIDPLAPQTL